MKNNLRNKKSNLDDLFSRPKTSNQEAWGTIFSRW